MNSNRLNGINANHMYKYAKKNREQRKAFKWVITHLLICMQSESHISSETNLFNFCLFMCGGCLIFDRASFYFMELHFTNSPREIRRHIRFASLGSTAIAYGKVSLCTLVMKNYLHSRKGPTYLHYIYFWLLWVSLYNFDFVLTKDFLLV